MSIVNAGARAQIQLIILIVFASLGFLYLATKVPVPSNIQPEDYFDFQAFWLVGKIWASGQNPYDLELFQKLFSETFHRSAGQLMWVYPPYWFPLIVPFALLPFKIAFSIWKVLNLALLIGATHLIARALADVTRQRYISIFLVGIGFGCLMRATPMTIWGGQTSILVYFGLSAIVFGLLKERAALVIIGLVFLALKPHIGIIAFAAVAALDRYRWTIVPAAGVCLVASTPILVAGGYLASVRGFLSNVALQSKSVSLGSDLTTGLIRISDFLPYTSNTFLIGLTIIFSAIVLAFLVFYNSSLNSAREDWDRQHQIASFVLFIAIVLLFTPLHSYDIVSLAAIWMMVMSVPLAGRWPITIGLLICLRPENLLGILIGPEAERAAGGSVTEKIAFPISYLVSVGLCLVFVGALWSVLVRRSQGRAWLGGSEQGNQAVFYANPQND